MFKLLIIMSSSLERTLHESRSLSVLFLSVFPALAEYLTHGRNLTQRCFYNDRIRGNLQCKGEALGSIQFPAFLVFLKCYFKTSLQAAFLAS